MSSKLLRSFACVLACVGVLASMEAQSSILSTSAKPSRVDDVRYQKLIDATHAVVGVKVKALADARSNASLGREREGSGVMIGREGHGLVLTISYLVLEADQVEVTDYQGQTVPATVVAYDHATGFGLVRPMAPIEARPIRLGSARPVSQRDRLMIVTGGEEQNLSIATVMSKREFAGYWEYLIEDAIFTSPPRLDHSGAALINQDGELVGIGSLFVLDALTPGEKLPGNMFVPVDLLGPGLDEMVRTGQQSASRRPWIGVNSLEEDGRVKVVQVNEESPAAIAGIQAGDIILSVEGQPIDSLRQFYQALWSRGPAGAPVNIKVLHGPNVRELVVNPIERTAFMKKRPAV